jgi:N-methylhydantoinase A/oxoprolinase/acetone carboxylase beta subunit
MPHVTSFGIGGGSHVHENGTVGPSSVGYKITTMGLAFGGDTCTATDVALADRPYDGLDRTRVSHLDPGLVSKALAYIKSKMELHVDMMKTSTDVSRFFTSI